VSRDRLGFGLGGLGGLVRFGLVGSVIGLDARVRPVEPSDAVRLQRMFARLSPDTIHRRFFTLMPRLSDSLLATLVTVDHARGEALVVEVGEEIVALASYHRSSDDPSVADIAVLVEDGWHRHGLGRRLVRALTRSATTRGVERFHADLLASNRPVVGMIRRLSPAARASFADGELVYDLPLGRAA
jgi:GNAT superfamily N-acetyltransferase